MKKIFNLVFVLLFLVSTFYLTYLPVHVSASAKCDFSFAPSSINLDTPEISVGIKSKELVNGRYRIHLKSPGSVNSFQLSNKVDFNGDAGASFKYTRPTSGWTAGQYTLYFINDNKTGSPESIADCIGNFRVIDNPVQTSCTLSITPTTGINVDTDVTLQVRNILSASYDIYVNKTYVSKFGGTSIPGEGDINIGKFATGRYIVDVKNRAGIGGLGSVRTQCNATGFDVVARGQTGGGALNSDQIKVTQDTQDSRVDAGCKADDEQCTVSAGHACDPKNAGKEDLTGAGTGVITAIGCIPTDPQELIPALLRVVIAAAGGLALLLMAFGAFGMITSGGNAESLKKANEQFVSAVVGLLFIIFAVLIMQVIGVDILNIPGLTR